MSEDDIERRLSDAFTAQAFAAAGDARPVPPPAFLGGAQPL
ncbi:MAG: hypothetical protein JWQ77_651, partial [Jatrophihabitans sp.]|nr:hypothetical protein [Jatrophihabitans sp.]